MKTLLVLCLLAAVSLADKYPLLPPFVYPHPTRGCQYIMGKCFKQCPENTHAYSIGCGEAISQRTCDEPTTRVMGIICDLSRCDCDQPLVKDLASGKCVLETECPEKSIPVD